MLLGAHMSIAGGFDKAAERGRSAGCDSLQIFTKNSNQWRARAIEAPQAEAFRAALAESGIGPVVAHDSYLINLASPDDELWLKSTAAFEDELRRCQQLGVRYLVTHPGAAKESSREDAMARVAEALDRIYGKGDLDVLTLLENTAGQGTTLGASFEELAGILGRATYPDLIGFCFDTCHAFAAGYDVRSPEGYAETIAQFDRLLGLDRLKCIHLNDSQKELGAHRDRHAHIGAGEIGLEGFANFVNDERFRELPGILETPKSDDLHEDRENLDRLRSLRHDAAATPAGDGEGESLGG